MYLAVLRLIVGQALILGRLELLLYAGIVALAFIMSVRVTKSRPCAPGSDPRTRPTAVGCPADGRAATRGSPRRTTGLAQRTEAGRLASCAASARLWELPEIAGQSQALEDCLVLVARVWPPSGREPITIPGVPQLAELCD